MNKIWDITKDTPIHRWHNLNLCEIRKDHCDTQTDTKYLFNTQLIKTGVEVTNVTKLKREDCSYYTLQQNFVDVSDNIIRPKFHTLTYAEISFKGQMLWN